MWLGLSHLHISSVQNSLNGNLFPVCFGGFSIRVPAMTRWPVKFGGVPALGHVSPPRQSVNAWKSSDWDHHFPLSFVSGWACFLSVRAFVVSF